MDDGSKPRNVAFMFSPSVASHPAAPLLHPPVLSSQRQMCFRKDKALLLSYALSTAVRKPDGSLLSHKSPEPRDPEKGFPPEDPV